MNREEFQKLKEESGRVALYREIPADHFTPITAYHALAKKGSCILESTPGTGEARYSFIGIDPIASFTAKGRNIEVRIEQKVEKFESDPYVALRAFQKRLKTAVVHTPAVFTGGVTGFISYDAIRSKEKIPDRHPDVLKLPDFYFQFYQSTVSFDHETGKAMIATITDDYEKGMEELDRLNEGLHRAHPMPVLSEKKEIEILSDLSDAEYGAMVERAKEHIRAGDIFQMVPSRTFQAKINVEPFQVYRALRQVSPAPFLFFFDLEGYAIAGASPEKIISVENRTIESTPIAGTRPKGGSSEELLSDPKEVAEHVMLVDLARNDVGAVSKPGSVQVLEYKKVQQFSHVMHIVSRVVGQLETGLDALDAFKASFPAGTLSGAPKVRAMELIDEIENSRRGLYGGAIVALDAFGNLISCIAIRTTLIKDGTAYVRAGAGIVLDSEPLTEAQESRHKANTVLDALKMACGGKS